MYTENAVRYQVCGQRDGSRRQEQWKEKWRSGGIVALQWGKQPAVGIQEQHDLQ